MIDKINSRSVFNQIAATFPLKANTKLVPPYYAQVFCGITPKLWKNQRYPAGCDRHQLLFEKFSIIPDYCFDCYKISIHPRTVDELFKLTVLFKLRKFAESNTRKCLINARKSVAEHYTGLIYCQDLEDAELLFKQIKTELASTISPDIPLYIKRGCTNFAEQFPGYAAPTSDRKLYTQEWKEIEANFDANHIAEGLEPLVDETYPHESFTLQDYLSILTWFCYAKTIGDDSYLQITNAPIIAIPGLQPKPFTPT